MTLNPIHENNNEHIVARGKFRPVTSQANAREDMLKNDPWPLNMRSGAKTISLVRRKIS